MNTRNLKEISELMDYVDDVRIDIIRKIILSRPYLMGRGIKLIPDYKSGDEIKISNNISNNDMLMNITKNKISGTEPFHIEFIEELISDISDVRDEITWNGDKDLNDDTMGSSDGFIKLLDNSGTVNRKMLPNYDRFRINLIIDNMISLLKPKPLEKYSLSIDPMLFKDYLTLNNIDKDIYDSNVSHLRNIRIYPERALYGSGKIILGNNEDFIFKTDLMGDNEEFDICNDIEKDGIRIRIKWTQKCEIENPEKIVYFNVTRKSFEDLKADGIK